MKGDLVDMMQTCTSCCDPILEHFSYRIEPDAHYHSACLRCSECRRSLVNDASCRTRDGRLYCRVDYERLFAVRCGGCDAILSKSDYVIRTRTKAYHPACFRCTACARVLASGEQCVLHDEQPYCQADSDLLCDAACNRRFGEPEYEQLANLNPDPNQNVNVLVNAQRSDGLTLRDATNKQLCNAASCSPAADSLHSPTSGSHAACFPDSPCSPSESSEFSGPRGAARQNARRADANALRTNKKGRKSFSAHEKSSRIRTVLSEKQLHTLRACYAANPRPDALMKDQLVEMTGLSPRVIRVWFQNKRCKDKKRSVLLKQLREQEQNGGRQRSELLYATPLIASTPMIYDASSNDCSVDVQPYCYPIANAAC